MGLRHFFSKSKKPVFVSRTYHGSSPSTKFGERRSNDEILVVRHTSPAQVAYTSAPTTKSTTRVATASTQYVSAPTRSAPLKSNVATAAARTVLVAKQQIPGSWPEEDDYHHQPALSQSTQPTRRPVQQYRQSRSRQPVIKQSFLHRQTLSDDAFIFHHPSPAEVYG